MVVTEKLSLSLISNSRQVRAPEKLYVVVTKLAIIMDVAEILFDSTCFAICLIQSTQKTKQKTMSKYTLQPGDYHLWLLYTKLGQENLLLDLVTYRKVRTEMIVVFSGSCLCISCWMIDDVFVCRGELDLSIGGTSVALFTVRLTRLNHENDRRPSCCFYM